MLQLSHIVDTLNKLFQIEQFGPDPAFSRFLPEVYEKHGDVRPDLFQYDFFNLYNGLMIKGGPAVSKIFCCAFPSQDCLDRIFEIASPGDFIFTHHALDMRCGNPWSEPAAGFIPYTQPILDTIRARALSLYVCHAPLDCHQTLSTSGAIVESLHGKPLGKFLPYGSGFAGIYCKVAPMTHLALLDKLKNIFDVRFIDEAGLACDVYEILAVVAGGGDRVSAMKEAQQFGCHAYITGHIRHFVDHPEYIDRRKDVEDWFKHATLSCFGVSHAASEFLVLKQTIKPLFEKLFCCTTICVAESEWWR